MRRLHPLSALALLLAVACDGNPHTDNGQLKVQNKTEQTITVYYSTEYSYAHGCGCDEHVHVDWRGRHIQVRANGEDWITVDSHGWDGEILVVYDGRERVYDVDFDIWGTARVTVRRDDFPVGDG